MKVLSSSDAFRDKYVGYVENLSEKLKAGGKGLAVTGGFTGVAATTAGVVAANASAWSAFTGLPLIGGLAAGKVAAAGVAAAAGVGAIVVVPALLVGGGICYVAYKNRQKSSLQQGTGIDELARAFASVACLPMLSHAVSLCALNPANREGVLKYLQDKLRDWGYSEEFVREGFNEALRHTSEEIIGHYYWLMGKLNAGSTEGIGATPAELPPAAVRSFAEEFRKDFDLASAA